MLYILLTVQVEFLRIFPALVSVSVFLFSFYSSRAQSQVGKEQYTVLELTQC